MKRKLACCTFSAGGALLLGACGIAVPIMRSKHKLSRLSLDAARSDVLRIMGAPDVMRGAQTLADGSMLQVDEYELYPALDAATVAAALCPLTLTVSCWVPLRGDARAYWVQYVNGRVERWGRAGDWQPNVTTDVTVRRR